MSNRNVCHCLNAFSSVSEASKTSAKHARMTAHSHDGRTPQPCGRGGCWRRFSGCCLPRRLSRHAAHQHRPCAFWVPWAAPSCMLESMHIRGPCSEVAFASSRCRTSPAPSARAPGAGRSSGTTGALRFAASARDAGTPAILIVPHLLQTLVSYQA